MKPLPKQVTITQELIDESTKALKRSRREHGFEQISKHCPLGVLLTPYMENYESVRMSLPCIQIWQDGNFVDSFAVSWEATEFQRQHFCWWEKQRKAETPFPIKLPYTFNLLAI